jgi:hypothetical protein
VLHADTLSDTKSFAEVRGREPNIALVYALPKPSKRNLFDKVVLCGRCKHHPIGCH